ncbi:nickel-dependent lactate racemase [Desulfofalx alkaliphila]|uniref:nickel-dependent lactate racemase n=1 Tax=Desulfofalx alkaliphila TaxID=105483 RepID=UPI0004E20C8B|nr:nickel-dependent lactate racemase [Desulfofalx alkaliphila]
MRIKLPYGKGFINAEIEDANLAGVLLPKTVNNRKPAHEIIATALSNPIGSPSLLQMAREMAPCSTAIIVSDITRPLPYRQLLPQIFSQLHRAGITRDKITIVIATGCHRPNSREETAEMLGREVANGYKIINHCCDSHLVKVGSLSDGTPLLINKTVAEARLKIALGTIIPHKMAGFSGGSKSILPGIAGRKTIEYNHAKLNHPQAKTGNWQNNPVRKQMDEAARMVGLNFILNVVTDIEDQLAYAVAGDVVQAWQTGVKHCLELNKVDVPHRCEAAIISCGGYPRDLNVYQAIKPMVNAAKVTAKGGTIVVCARCQEGYGDKIFSRWLKESNEAGDMIERFRRQFVLGGHKAYVLAKLVNDVEVVLVSDLSQKETELLYFNYKPNLARALEYLKEKHGPSYRAWLMPYAGLLLIE